MKATTQIGSGMPQFELPNGKFMGAANERVRRAPVPRKPSDPLPDHYGSVDWEDCDQ